MCTNNNIATSDFYEQQLIGALSDILELKVSDDNAYIEECAVIKTKLVESYTNIVEKIRVFSNIAVFVTNIRETERLEDFQSRYFVFLSECQKDANSSEDGIICLVDIKHYISSVITLTELSRNQVESSSQNYTNKMKQQFNNALSILCKKSRDDLAQFSDSVKERIEDAHNKSISKIDLHKNELVAVLGIFAAIIAAFMGSLNLSSSVLENIHKAETFHTLFILSILGLFILNIIFCLICTVDSILHNKYCFHLKIW